MTKIQLLLIILALSAMAVAQEPIVINGIPRDTSFTLYSSFQKYKIKNPEIQPVFRTYSSNVTVHENLVYADYGQRKMPLDLFLPKNQKEKSPVVVMIHGGGWISGNKNLTWPMAEYLAQRGYVCASVEYRMLLEAQYPAAVKDIKTAIRWLRTQADVYSIDTTKFAIYGCSAGGQLAALVASTNNENLFTDPSFYPTVSDHIQALIDLDGVFQFLHPKSSEVSQNPDKPSLATRWLGATPHENPERWAEASALSHVGPHMPPCLFIASQYDRFLAGHEEARAKLDSMGIYSEKHQITGSPHPFWLFDPWFAPVSQWVGNFLDEQFKQ